MYVFLLSAKKEGDQIEWMR